MDRGVVTPREDGTYEAIQSITDHKKKKKKKKGILIRNGCDNLDFDCYMYFFSLLVVGIGVNIAWFSVVFL